VLGGGGVHGAAEVGMLRALAERGVGPDPVVGTSIGALDGGVLAADPDGAAKNSADRSRPRSSAHAITTIRMSVRFVKQPA